MVADTEIVRDRMARIRRYLKDLRDFSDISESAFCSNKERLSDFERYIEAIERYLAGSM